MHERAAREQAFAAQAAGVAEDGVKLARDAGLQVTVLASVQSGLAHNARTPTLIVRPGT